MMNMNALQTLTEQEMAKIVGGHALEESFADAALYRAGVSYVFCFFGSDEYYVGSTRISKALAKELRAISTYIWNSQFAEEGDMINYLKAWKDILQHNYGINWNGEVGSYSCHAA